MVNTVHAIFIGFLFAGASYSYYNSMPGDLIEEKTRIDSVQRIESVIYKRYLNIPLLVDKEAHLSKMHLWINDVLLGEFDVPFAMENPDYYGAIDLSGSQGKTLVIEVTKFTGDLSGITLDNEIKGAENLYNEIYRPQLHFTAKRGWLNDPNGLIYYKGKYHMYYQYNPLRVHHGNMSWGHAVSTDLVHWEEHTPVLYPDSKTGACYSGAAFIDHHNQLGKKTGLEDVIVAFYLRTRSGLSLAYSDDGGQTMTDYEGNPVLDHPAEEYKLPDARMDTPRPFWFEPTKRWITPTFDYFTNDKGDMLRCVGFYSSANLTDWVYESRVEQDKWGDELCGCVDFFQLPVDGDQNNRLWVMVFIDGSYIVGTFDGNTFYTMEVTPASTSHRIKSLVPGGNFVATMTWDNMPDDRRIQITWMANWGEYYGMPFSQQMTLPSELTLCSAKEGPRLRMNPIEEMKKLRLKSYVWDNLELNSSTNPLSTLHGELYEMEVQFTPGIESETVIYLHGFVIRYVAETGELYCNNHSSKLTTENGMIKLHIFIDLTSIEIYANEGQVYFPYIHIGPDDARSYSLTSRYGQAYINSLRVHELRSIWE